MERDAENIYYEPGGQVPDDTEQIDDQVQGLYMTGVADGVVDWYGGISPDADVFERMYQRFRKDLASLGIRLTYDTTIGGER